MSTSGRDGSSDIWTKRGLSGNNTTWSDTCSRITGLLVFRRTGLVERDWPYRPKIDKPTRLSVTHVEIFNFQHGSFNWIRDHATPSIMKIDASAATQVQVSIDPVELLFIGVEVNCHSRFSKDIKWVSHLDSTSLAHRAPLSLSSSSHHIHQGSAEIVYKQPLHYTLRYV